jgi:hypothetical protein
MDITDFELDLDAAEDGTFFALDTDCGLYIAQWNNKEHSRYLRDIYKKYGHRMRNNALQDEEARQLLAGQWPFVLKGWKGLTENGEPLEYSKQVVIDLALNPQYREFFRRVQNIAETEENFRKTNIRELGEDAPTI